MAKDAFPGSAWLLDRATIAQCLHAKHIAKHGSLILICLKPTATASALITSFSSCGATLCILTAAAAVHKLAQKLDWSEALGMLSLNLKFILQARQAASANPSVYENYQLEYGAPYRGAAGKDPQKKSWLKGLTKSGKSS